MQSELRFQSLAGTDELEDRKTVPCVSEITYESYVSHLCAVQRETRALLVVDGCPASGQGSDRATVRCSR